MTLSLWIRWIRDTTLCWLLVSRMKPFNVPPTNNLCTCRAVRWQNLLDLSCKASMSRWCILSEYWIFWSVFLSVKYSLWHTAKFGIKQSVQTACNIPLIPNNAKILNISYKGFEISKTTTVAYPCKVKGIAHYFLVASTRLSFPFKCFVLGLQY